MKSVQISSTVVSWVTSLFIITYSVFPQVTRGPYLQVQTPNSIIIRWNTKTNVIGTVKYGESLSLLTRTITESKKRTYHEVRVSHLSPNTQYYYTIDGSSSGNRDQYFLTAPPQESKEYFRIWVISDFGQTNSEQNERRRTTVNGWKLFNHDSYHADIAISLGDQTEDDSIYQLEYNYFPQLAPVLKNTPLFTVVGNHDAHDGLYNYHRTFTVPSHGEGGGIPSGSKDYYSFDYANAHFVVLYTELQDSDSQNKQIEWLKNDLSHNKKEWLISCMHRPFLSGGYHHSDTSRKAQIRRSNWLRILEDHDVDVILQGHNHDYERSYMIDNLIGTTSTFTDKNKKDTGTGRMNEGGAYKKKIGITHQGEIFIEVAAGGDANPREKLVHYPMFPVVFGDKKYEGSVVMDIHGDTLTERFLCDEKNKNGSHIWDHFTIIKTSGQGQ